MKKLSENKKLLWIVGGALAAVIAIAVILVLCLGGNAPADPTEIDYTLEVRTEGGMAMEGLDVYVYSDASLEDLVAIGKTDKNGLVSFSALESDSYVATLSGAPAGYVVAESYPITQSATQIALKIQLLQDADLTKTTFKAGDVMFDFTINGAAGESYTLSQLLEEKDAVLLNFWFINCPYCVAEFPYLQEAYEQYGENVAILAVNPVDDQPEVEEFKTQEGLSFPMCSVSAAWDKAFNIQGYPTTVVVDRYGTVSLVHTGAFDDTQTVVDLIDYYTQEGYKQQKLSSVEDIYSADGSQERPFEFGGVTEFEVTVPAGETVYCDVYKVTGMKLTIEDSQVQVLYGEDTYDAADGKVEFVITDGDSFTPSKLGIKNTGAATKTVKVTFSLLPGTMGNPYPLQPGSFTVSIVAGNDQGVYYLYTATEDGVVSMQCTGATEGVGYDFTLYNLTTATYLTLENDGVEGVLSIEVHAGDELQFSANTLPNDQNEYPAASLSFTAAFAAGDVGATEGPTEAPTEAPNSNSGSQSGDNSGGSTDGNSGGSHNDSTGGETDNAGDGTDVGSYTELYVGQALNVGEGTTNVTLTSGKINYFLFTPTKSGTYSVGTSGTISYWGNNLQYIEQDQAKDLTIGDNVISLNIKDGNLGSSFVIGIKAGRKETSGTITITRTGNAVLGIEDSPVVEYTGTHTPTKNFPASAADLTIVDITASTSAYTLVKGSDGFYHLGSASGPLVYLDFDDTTRMGALNLILTEGVGLSAYVQKNGNTVNEEYTNLFAKYVECMDANGRYPLTDDLIYILKNFGAQQSWWDVSNNGILTGIVGLNTEIAWMCACYY